MLDLPRMDMRKQVGRNFARLRREMGLTQQDVETRSGYGQQYLSGLERGKRNLSGITLNEIAHALGVSHVELVFKNSRVPVGMVAAMSTQGATTEATVADYLSLTVRMGELAEIWTTAHWVIGPPPKLSDLGATVNNAMRFSLGLPPGKSS